jgi:A/G-specific adenine glycosylase
MDAFRRPLLAWYRQSRRDLPWRGTRDPYAIWISEIMLQQTRVDTVIGFYHRWMDRFPTVDRLAAAPLDEVLASWAGLGYYARARNLHAAAKEIAVRYQSRFPDDADAVRALPGIGRYTAGAILSIAFGRPEPILDGNVARVLSRVFRIAGAPTAPATQRALWDMAARLVPKNDASDFNQAMMELGALVCVKAQPACDACPLARLCRARAMGEVDRFPAPKIKKPPKVVHATAVAIHRASSGDAGSRETRWLLLRRPPRGLWGGLWEPLQGPVLRGERAAAAAERLAGEHTGLKLSAVFSIERFDHVLTHRIMHFSAYRAMARGRLRLHGYDAARWVTLDEAERLGVAAWTTRLLSQLRRS